LKGLIRNKGKFFRKLSLFTVEGIDAIFFSTLPVILNKFTVIMSNSKTGKNPICKSPDVFEDRSEQIQTPGHA
jgi:hypothetical protein